MMKHLFALALVVLFFGNAQARQAQEDKLTRLMNEREQLVMEYQYYNQQNSNFWGKKSKKDLINIIETLKGVIKKDSELINAVKEASVKKIAETTVETKRIDYQSVADQRLIDSRINDLKGQLTTLQSQMKKRERTIKDLEEQLAGSDEQRYGKDKVIAILAVACFLFLLYAGFLQVRLNKATSKGRKKTKKV